MLRSYGLVMLNSTEQWTESVICGLYIPGEHSSVREFQNCQGNVRDFTKSQGSVIKKILLGKSGLKLFIVNCIFASIQVFSTSMGMMWVTLNVPSATEECRELSGNCHHIIWRVVTQHQNITILRLIHPSIHFNLSKHCYNINKTVLRKCKPPPMPKIRPT